MEIRTCAECEAEYMPGRKNQKICLASACKASRRKRLLAEFHTRNPERMAEYLEAFRAKQPGVYHGPARQAKADKVDALKTAPCVDCGGTFPTVCMDFDHRPGGVKVACVSSLVMKQCSWERIEAEIAKCDLVCSNCHRIRTRGRRLSSRAQTVVHGRGELT